MIKRILAGVGRRLRRPEFQEAGTRVHTYHLAVEGEVRFAEWLHTPAPTPVVTQRSVDFYKHFIQPGDLAIDIGAHAGDTTVPMALAAGPSGKVLALEPNPHVFKVLQENVDLNPGKTHIVPLNFAAATDDTEYVFGSGDPCYINGGIVGHSSNTRGNTRYRFRIQGRDLSRFLLHHHAHELDDLTFVKIDAEGYDKEILENLRPILAEHRPAVVAECFEHLKANERNQLFDAVASVGYRLFSLATFGPWTGRSGGHGVATLPELRREDMHATRHFDFLCLPRDQCEATLLDLARASGA